MPVITRNTVIVPCIAHKKCSRHTSLGQASTLVRSESRKQHNLLDVVALFDDYQTPPLRGAAWSFPWYGAQPGFYVYPPMQAPYALCVCLSGSGQQNTDLQRDALSAVGVDPISQRCLAGCWQPAARRDWCGYRIRKGTVCAGPVRRCVGIDAFPAVLDASSSVWVKASSTAGWSRPHFMMRWKPSDSTWTAAPERQTGNPRMRSTVRRAYPLKRGRYRDTRLELWQSARTAATTSGNVDIDHAQARGVLPHCTNAADHLVPAAPTPYLDSDAVFGVRRSLDCRMGGAVRQQVPGECKLGMLGIRVRGEGHP